METIFMNTENSKINKHHKFVLNLSQRLDIKSTVGYITLQYLIIHYTWKNIRKQYKNNKLKIIAPTWNNELQLLNGSYYVSDIQDDIKYIIKKYETMKHPLIHVYTNRINNRFVFKIKDG